MTTPSPVVPSGVLVRTPGGSCPEGILSKFIIRDRRAKLALVCRGQEGRRRGKETRRRRGGNTLKYFN